MEHARPADLLGAALRFQVAVNADEVGQVGLLRVATLLAADLNEEVGQLLDGMAHGFVLRNLRGPGKSTREYDRVATVIIQQLDRSPWRPANLTPATSWPAGPQPLR